MSRKVFFTLAFFFSVFSQDAVTQERIPASQLGFAPAMKKQFSSPVSFTAFEIKRVSDGATVFVGGGPLRTVSHSVIGGATVWIGDFSGLTTPGRYTIVVRGKESYPFDIRADIFDQTTRDVQRMFYYQRAFTAITTPYAEGPWVHPSDIVKAPPGVVKGWHDAGDLAVYMPTMTQSIFWMLEAWSDFRPLDDDTNIPESGNGVPDLLDEARWGLEWVISMQDANGGFWGVACPGCSGSGYYYGRTTPNTIGNYCKVIPPTVQNTAKAIAVLGYASVVFAPYDVRFAASCLSAAEAGWAWMTNNPGATDDSGPCNAYAQGSDAELLKTNRMWAAAGLLYATGNPVYEAAFQSNYVTMSWISSFSKSEAFGGSLYLRVPAGASQSTKDVIKQRILSLADGVRSAANGHPYQFATHYYWGTTSNGMHRSGQFSWRAHLLDPSRVADRDQALANLDYIYGRNILNQCYVSGTPGATKQRIRGFHHWMKTLNTSPWHFPGALSSGPNQNPLWNDVSYPSHQPFPIWGYWGDPSNPRDNGTPVDARFTDNDSWSTNEIAINWNAALLYNLYGARKFARHGQVTSLDEGSIPNALHLYQNYPNPFNPSTTIRYDLPQDSHVKLTVVDLLGSEVSKLVDETVTAGSHEVTFDGSSLASGIYFYRIQIGESIQARRMILLK